MPNLIEPMTGRDPAEQHRTATPLELLFDLASVIAIAAAAAGLHHAIAADHTLEGLVRFVMAFFAIWWAWMNYTWFASAYDNEDTLFRILSMVIIGGAVTMAAGITLMFEALDLRIVVAGYVIMRLPMCILWLRASRGDPSCRETNLRYAIGIALVQIFWVSMLFIPAMTPSVFYGLFVLGVVLELAIPAVAERSGVTPWHKHHIMERYGLLLIIVLGEVLTAAALSLRTAFTEEYSIMLVHTAMAAVVILAAMWWLYFSKEEHLHSDELCHAFSWGYGHAIVFASAAAVGAGIGVLVDIISGKANVGIVAGDFAVGFPLAIYMLGLWFVRDRHVLSGTGRMVLPAAAVAVLVSLALAPMLEIIAGIAVMTVAVRSFTARRDGTLVSK